MTGVVLHPTEQNLVYARTDVGGAYRWEASTNSWTQLITADRVPASVLNFPDTEFNTPIGNGIGRTRAYTVESIGIDPQNPNVLYVASGDGLNQAGIFMKSTDRGESFELLSLNVPCEGNGVLRGDGERWAVDPANSNIVYFGSRSQGLWRSTDGGGNWQQIPASALPFGQPVSGTPIGSTVLVFDPQSPVSNGATQRIYASVGGEGVYVTENAGGSWTRLPLPSGAYANDMEVSNGVLYLASQGNGLFRYTPSDGLTDVSPADRRVGDVAVDPQNNQRVYASTSFLKVFYRSEDGGSTWTSLGTNTLNEAGRQGIRSTLAPWKESSTVRFSLAIGELAIDPFNSSRMWIAEGMGTWRIDDLSPTNNTPVLNDISRGIEEMVATDIVSAPNNNLVVSAWDRIGFHYTDPDQYPDEQISVADRFSAGVSLDAAPSDPNFIAVSVADIRRFCCGEGNASGFSTNGGASWNLFGSVTQTGTTVTEELEYVNNPESLNFGEIAIAATDVNNMAWIPRDDVDQGIYYTTNQGATWQQSALDPTADDLNFYFLTSRRALAADQVAPGTFYFYSLGGQTGNEGSPSRPARLFKSTDQGASFQAVSTGQIPFRSFNGQLKAAPENEGHLWFATGVDYREPAQDRGLFFSNNGGETFNRLPGIIDCWVIGFGAKRAGQTYPTIFMYGETEAEGWGAYLSDDQGASWRKLVTYPLGIFDEVRAISGDFDEFGKVYIGFSGNSFVYGTPGTIEEPEPEPPTGTAGDFTQTEAGLVAMEAENFSSRAPGTGAFSSLSWETQADPEASQAEYVRVNASDNNTFEELTGPRINFNINFVRSGTHYLWARILAPTVTDDSCIPVLDGVSQGSWSTGVVDSWGWRRYTINDVSTESRTLSMYMREDGIQIDKLLLTTDVDFAPTGTGPDETITPAALTSINNARSTEEVSSPSAIAIYPNPLTEGELTLQLGTATTGELEVRDALGRLVLTRRLNQQTKVSLAKTDLTEGMLLLTIRTPKGYRQTKFLVQ